MAKQIDRLTLIQFVFKKDLALFVILCTSYLKFVLYFFHSYSLLMIFLYHELNDVAEKSFFIVALWKFHARIFIVQKELSNELILNWKFRFYICHFFNTLLQPAVSHITPSLLLFQISPFQEMHLDSMVKRLEKLF